MECIICYLLLSETMQEDFWCDPDAVRALRQSQCGVPDGIKQQLCPLSTSHCTVQWNPLIPASVIPALPVYTGISSRSQNDNLVQLTPRLYRQPVYTGMLVRLPRLPV